MRTACILITLIVATACNSSGTSGNSSKATESAQQDSSSISFLQEMAYADGHIPQHWIDTFPKTVQEKINSDRKKALVTRVWKVSENIYAIVLSMENDNGYEEVLLTYKAQENIKDSKVIAYQFKNALNRNGLIENQWLSDNSLRIIKQVDQNGSLVESETTWTIQKTGDIVRPITSYAIHPNSYSDSYKTWPNYTFQQDQIFLRGKMVGRFPTQLEQGKSYRFENDDGYTLLMVKRLNYSSLAFFFRIKDRILSGTADLNLASVNKPASIETQIGLRNVVEYTVSSSTDPCIEKLQFIEVDGNNTSETSGMIVRTSDTCSLRFADQTELYIPLSK